MARSLWQRSRCGRRIASISAALAGACRRRPHDGADTASGHCGEHPEPRGLPKICCPGPGNHRNAIACRAPGRHSAPNLHCTGCIRTALDLDLAGDHPRARAPPSLTRYSSSPASPAPRSRPAPTGPIIRGLDSYRVRIQENGIGTHDVSALPKITPFRSTRSRPIARGRARPGDVALRRAGDRRRRQRRERAHSEFIPKGGFSGRIIGGYSSVDNGADGAIKVTAGSGGVAVHADAFKRDADDYSSPHGRRSTLSSTARASLGASLVGTDGFFGVSFSPSPASMASPARKPTRAHAHRHGAEQSAGEGRVACPQPGIETVRFWFGASAATATTS